MQQNAGSGTEQQELSSRLPIASADINNAAQHGEQFGHPLHFIQDHQSMALREQETFRIIQLTLGGRQFQVEVQGIALQRHFGQRQRSLADLARPQQNHRRELGKEINQLLLCKTRVHPCNLSFIWKICTVYRRNQTLFWILKRRFPRVFRG